MPLFMLSSIPASPPSFNPVDNNHLKENISLISMFSYKKKHTNDINDWKSLNKYSLFYLPRTLLSLIDNYLHYQIKKDWFCL